MHRHSRQHGHVKECLRATTAVVDPSHDIPAGCEHEPERLVLVDVLAGADIGRKNRPVSVRANPLGAFDPA